MKRCNLDCQFLSEFDLFGKEPEFYFKGKPQRTSKFGKVLTYFYIFIYVGFFLYKVIRMLEKVDITFYETYAYAGVPSIKLTSDLFYGGFSLNGMIDPTIYYPVVLYYEGHRENGEMVWAPPTMMDIEICQLEKFGEKYRDLFKDHNLQNSYCLKDINKVTLEGYPHLDSFKYIQIYFYPCIGYAPTLQECKSTEEVTRFFANGAKITFNIQDIELTPTIYDTPSQPREKGIQGPAFLTLYQQVYTYLQIVILETDKDVIGFEGLSDIETQQFIKYDESWIVVAPSPHQTGLVPEMPIADVSIQLSSKVLTQKRKNTKLIEVLGDVGGLMEVVWSFFNIIATLITDILYDKALINNLFSFDLDKKIIQIKRKKTNNYNENIQFEDSPRKYSQKDLLDNFSGKNLKQEISEKNNEEGDKKLTHETKKKKKKKKIKLKQKKTMISSLSRNMTNKNLEDVEIKNKDDINIYNKQKENMFMASEAKIVFRETKTNSENRGLIDRIKMKCCCIYFWFCFSRKKKNIQNILMDEGMDIIVENLDIMNIFKKINSINNIEESLKTKEYILNMSDNCKSKLHSLFNKES